MGTTQPATESAANSGQPASPPQSAADTPAVSTEPNVSGSDFTPSPNETGTTTNPEPTAAEPAGGNGGSESAGGPGTIDLGGGIFVPAPNVDPTKQTTFHNLDGETHSFEPDGNSRTVGEQEATDTASTIAQAERSHNTAAAEAAGRDPASVDDVAVVDQQKVADSIAGTQIVSGTLRDSKGNPSRNISAFTKPGDTETVFTNNAAQRPADDAVIAHELTHVAQNEGVIPFDSTSDDRNPVEDAQEGTVFSDLGKEEQAHVVSNELGG